MRKSVSWMVCGAVLAGLVLASMGHEVEARPPYLKEFLGAYPKVKAEGESAKCLVCHYGDSKKNKNDYGMAVGEALGEKNIKDAEKIAGALKEAAKGKSSVEGKTFGDLIEDGKLPGKNP